MTRHDPTPAAPTQAGAERLVDLLRLPGGCCVDTRGEAYVVTTYAAVPRPPVKRWMGAPVVYRIGSAAPLTIARPAPDAVREEGQR